MNAPPKYAVAADTVVLARFADGPRVLLIARKHPPLGWAIPGGFVEPEEDLPDAAVRELREETGIAVAPAALRLIGVYGRPGRDPRGRTITAAYGLALDDPPAAAAGDDAAGLRWFPIDALPANVAFDHADILRDAIEHVRPTP